MNNKLKSFIENYSLKESKTLHIENEDTLSVKPSVWSSQEYLKISDNDEEGKMGEYAEILLGDKELDSNHDQKQLIKLAKYLEENDVIVPNTADTETRKIRIISNIEFNEFSPANFDIEKTDSLSPDVDDVNHIVLVIENYRRAKLEELNDIAVNKDVSISILLLERNKGYIASFEPPKTACIECMESRLNSSISPGEKILKPDIKPEKPIKNVIFGLLEKNIRGGLKKGFEGNIIEIDLALFEIKKHRVFKAPRCRACGTNQPTQNSLNIGSLDELFDENKD